MKYIELLTILFFLLISGSATAKGIYFYSKLCEKNELIIKQNDSCNFISKSFINTCKGKGFKSLNEWQQKCKSIWNLDYISWCNCKEFMPKDEIGQRNILYGRWVGENIEGEVYWEINNEK